jgi:hypothetical protein
MNYSEIVNSDCELVEQVVPQFEPFPFGVVFACTECGEEARFVKEKVIKTKKIKQLSLY